MGLETIDILKLNPTGEVVPIFGLPNHNWSSSGDVVAVDKVEVGVPNPFQKGALPPLKEPIPTDMGDFLPLFQKLPVERDYLPRE
jgi:hypothetical protein